MSRFGFVASVLVCVSLAARAYAQDAAVTMEDLLEPLAASAEAALQEDLPALASARATIVIETVSPSSPLATRAQTVIDTAAQMLGDGRAPDVTGTALDPMLDAAEAARRDGNASLADARIEFVAEMAPPASATAARAASMRASAETPVPVPSAEAAEAPHDEFSDVVAAPEPRVAAASQHEAEAPSVPASSDATAAPTDPTRRDDAEIVELYITATTFGVYTGFWVPFGSGLQGGQDRNPESLLYSLSILAGGGLFALGVSALDSGEGLRAGVGASTSASLRYGVALGFLMWGAFDPVLSPNGHCDPSAGGTYTCTENRAGLAERTSLPLVFGATGALVGLGVGLGLRPTIEQVRAVEMGGLWGGAIGLLSALGASQDSSQGFAITATGVGVGLLGTAIASGMGVRMGGRRLGFMTLGLGAGALAGLLVPAIGSAGAHGWSWPLFSVTGATALAGLIIAGLVTNGMDEGPSQGPDVHLSFGPTEGGGLATVSGTF